MSKTASHCLIVPVWGPTFTQLCIDFMLPSLLAPGNLDGTVGSVPVLAFACPSETRTALLASPVLEALQQHAHVEFIDISDLLADQANKYRAMTDSIYRAISSDFVKPKETALVFLNPDVICSTGVLATIDRAMAGGKRAVMVPGMRTRAEQAHALLGPYQRGLSLSVPSQDLGAFAVGALHPLDQAYLWEEGPFPVHWPSKAMFRTPDGGIGLHSFYLHPLAILCPDPMPESLDTIDGTFLQECGLHAGDIFVPRDTRDIVVIELSETPDEIGLATGQPSRKRMAEFAVRHVSDIHWDLFDNYISYTAVGTERPPALDRLYRYVRAHRPRRRIARRWPRFDRRILSHVFHVIASIKAR